MLKEIQVKDLSKMVDKNTKLIIDADGIAYKPAAVCDDAYIEVLHKQSGATKEFKNLSEFKGKVRKEGAIGSGSWLFSENLNRRARGGREFTLDEFEVTSKTKQKLKLTVATNGIDRHIRSIEEDLGVKDSTLILGKGDTFRHKLLLPEQYKATREDKPRPSQLGNCRQYMRDNFNTLLIQDGIHEADDVVNMYAWKGYVDYLKTGKFSYIVASNDKDQRGCPSLLRDWSKDGDSFKVPRPFLIEDTNKTIGGLEIIKGSVKAYGFVNLIYQMLAGDDADNYDPRSVKGKLASDNFGDASLFMELSACKTAKDLLAFVIETYSKWYPDGLHFTAWNGVEVHEDIYWWMNTMFQLVYMKRSKTDKTTFDMILNKFGMAQNNQLVAA